MKTHSEMNLESAQSHKPSDYNKDFNNNLLMSTSFQVDSQKRNLI